MKGSGFATGLALGAALISITGTLAAASNDAQLIKQDPLMYMGVQCGNALDTTATGCYIGTIGTLLTGSDSNDYLLSNNHVFARSNAASIGEDIDHLAASLCDLSPVHVGELAAFVPISFKRRNPNLVDAALARITPDVSVALSNGHVLTAAVETDFSDAFPVMNTTVSPSLGMVVKKSGRTTGLTTGSVYAVGVDVYVNYDGGRAYFIDQFVVQDGTFSSAGDSGSLILKNDSNEPVGLLFAGSTSYTIGNRIDNVLSELGSVLGGVTLSFGSSGDGGVTDLTAGSGGSGGGSSGGGGGGKGGGHGGGKPKSGLTVAQAAIEHASLARDRNVDQILSVPGVVGSGIAFSPDGTRPVIQVYAASNASAVRRQLPRFLDGIEVQVVETGEFEAY